MTSEARIIFYLSMLIWILPPFKQRGTRYFNFFLILAIADPLGVILYKAFAIYPMSLYLIISCLCLISVLDKVIVRKHLPLILGGIFLSFLSAFLIPADRVKYVLPVFDFAILLVLMKNFMVQSYNTKQMTLFNFVFVMYVISLIVKFVLTITEVKTGHAYFYFTNAFEILIGIYFTLFNEDKPGWALNIAESRKAVG